MQEKKLENRVVCVPFESNEYSSIIKPPSKFREALLIILAEKYYNHKIIL